MKKIITIMIVILGTLVALVLVAPSSAENVKNLPDSAKYVMFRSDLWKVPNAAENCGEVTVSRKKGDVYADFYFISPLKNQLYDIILNIPGPPYCDCTPFCPEGEVCEDCGDCDCDCYALCAAEVSIGVVVTDENGIGDKVIKFDQKGIMEALYAHISAIAPFPLPPIEQWFAGALYLPSPSFTLKAVIPPGPPCYCGEDCCMSPVDDPETPEVEGCIEGDPCPPPPPPDGGTIVNAFKLTSDGSPFFE